MTHLWIRAEQRPQEERVGITPDGVAALRAKGFRVTIEDSPRRAVPIAPYTEAGAERAAYGSWPDAPTDAIIFGLKELPEDGTPLRHRHIMFGHAYKGQPAGQELLRRFRQGGGVLYDLEYLTDAQGRRVAAFGYWAGYAGAAVSLLAYAAQARGGVCAPVARFADKTVLVDAVAQALAGLAVPRVLVIGALGRVGRGAADMCAAVGAPVTAWDKAETEAGGPFPEVLAHDLFLNCILAMPGTPVFVPQSAVSAPRALRVIGDIACDPTSDFSPVKVYDRATDWARPVLRVHGAPVLDVMAIDNLPSLLPIEASEDFAAQLLPHLQAVDAVDAGIWGRARAEFDRNIRALEA
ncbi:saccharopine dehydrogenase [Roseibaca sp. V10]|uniref:Saccharopine dehydrogenase [NAD(+), L-lysine-forming] n=1 Tax=Roseinatronobacter domitianus TaxID=2940293 RepID=A0ABT0LZ43_9RHOB|nr:saccharopine dehydrogenase [Roseibaca domitiana]MCL1627658.1 saccharopine dehydrogenase [Roseibaca domitiana]